MSSYHLEGRSVGMTLFRAAGLGTPRDSELYEGPMDLCEDRYLCLFWEAVQAEHETLCPLTAGLQFLPAGGTGRQQALGAGCVRPRGGESERSPAGVWEDMRVPGLSMDKILRRARLLTVWVPGLSAPGRVLVPGPWVPSFPQPHTGRHGPTRPLVQAGVLADLVCVSWCVSCHIKHAQQSDAETVL